MTPNFSLPICVIHQLFETDDKTLSFLQATNLPSTLPLIHSSTNSNYW